MTVIFFLIPISVIIAAGFLALFIWAVRSGQYEDTCTPSMRLLLEEKACKQPSGARKGGSHDVAPPATPEQADEATTNV